MRRRHLLPFGAEVEAGGVRFRLWAPGAGRVELVIDGGPGVAMTAGADGWFETRVPGLKAGARYRYRLDGGIAIPDPASRAQPDGVHGSSEVVDPAAFDWDDGTWRGRPWSEAVIYELHVGTFSPDGTFRGVIERLDHLAALGVTVLELMPVAAFAGAHGWGYDGVQLFAPHAAYGRPDDLKALVCAAHRRGLMVFLDVVYNHFGAEGNYLYVCARDRFFDLDRDTPWGAAIAFDRPGSRPVRDFFVHNALYWLEEYGFDGLRFDAVHAIDDRSAPHILDEIADAVRTRLDPARAVHLVLENDANQVRYLERGGDDRPPRFVAQWNDDVHHVLHVLLTGEGDGYYADYADDPGAWLVRCLADGFAYQGDPSPYRGGAPRGEPSRHLPTTAFVAFAQNHDQIGNRAFGERLTVLAPPEAVRAAQAVILLAPMPPLLFMGEEWGSTRPFQFFCDLGPDLADAVRDGRRAEFARFERFARPEARAAIPDPLAAATVAASRLDWEAVDGKAVDEEAVDEEEGREHLAFCRALLHCRRDHLAPRLGPAPRTEAARRLGRRGADVTWRLGDGSRLRLLANLGADAVDVDTAPAGPPLFRCGAAAADRLGPWSVAAFLDVADGGR